MNIKNKQNGYALLFSLVIISAVSIIAAGLSSTSYKQLVLSSLVKDSQTAFYYADMASECALYSNLVKRDIMVNNSTFLCGIDKNNQMFNYVVSSDYSGYSLKPNNLLSGILPCSIIQVGESSGVAPGSIDVDIKSKGYNICKTDNPRSVEREIQVRFTR